MKRSDAYLACLLALAACSYGVPTGGEDAAGEPADASGSFPDGPVIDGGLVDAPLGTDSGTGDGDGGAGNPDASTGTVNSGTGVPDASPDGAGSIITGGPCISGAPGATAYRIRWADGGGTAYVVYEVNGLPQNSGDHAGAYGYQIGFTPSFVDPYLGEGGLQLDSSCFVDIELSTVGLSQIDSATLSIYGRSYHTTTSGSFNWQTFDGVGSTPTNLVSNGAPYAWYSGDMTTEISPADDGILIRIKAGLSSNSLVVNRIELCMEAN